MQKVEMINKDLEQLKGERQKLQTEKDNAIVSFFNEEYGSCFSNDRVFACFSDLFAEDGESEGYFNPYDLQLGWGEIRLLLHWQTVHELNIQQGRLAEMLEMLTLDDNGCCLRGEHGLDLLNFNI